MESIDLLVLRTARDWLLAGQRVLLATVARTWGSSPRPVGSMMALRGDGRVVGSVSGGCIEDDLIHRYTTAYQGGGMPHGLPQVVQYGVSADEAQRFGLPCGGTLELILEFEPALASLEQLLPLVDSGNLVRRELDLDNGQVHLTTTGAPEQFGFDGRHMLNTLGPGYRMLLIGAGVLAEYLATMALFNGFKVAVCDPRPEYMDGWNVSGVEKIVGMPDDVCACVRPGPAQLHHRPQPRPQAGRPGPARSLAQPGVLHRVIGSRRNNQSRRERLIEHFGVSEASLQRLHGPIGIYIGSKTPAEIAVSVMAEILATKNGVALPGEVTVSEAKRALEVDG